MEISTSFEETTPSSFSAFIVMGSMLLGTASHSDVRTVHYVQEQDVSQVRNEQIIHYSMPEIETVKQDWDRDNQWENDAVQAIDNFVSSFIDEIKEPDPEAARILEDNLWDLV